MSELKTGTGEAVESPVLARIVEALGGMVLEVEEQNERRGWVRVDPARVRDMARILFHDQKARLATVTGIDVRDGIDILYHWCLDAERYVVTIKALAARPAMAIDSVGQDLPAADWIEREMHDLLGAEFRGHPDMRRLILADNWPEGVYPLRRDFKVPKVDALGRRETNEWAGAPVKKEKHPTYRPEKPLKPGRMLINVGPFHPLQEEAEFFQLHCEGETVVDMDMRTSYNHRGIEELSTRLTWDQVPFLVERVCGICSASHPWAYIRAVENICGIEAPERAKYLRTIVAELERLHSHMLWIGLAGHFLGYNTVWMWTWKYREPVMDILELITGSRIHYANNTIGGVRRDIPADLYPEIRKAVDSLKAPLNLITKAVLDDPVLHARLKVGKLTEEEGRRWGITGPTARGSNIDIDARRDDPLGVYDQIEWKVITHDGCDVFAKAVVRCLECFEAIKIIEQCLDQIPEGPIQTRVDEIPRGEGCGHYEAPRGETFHYVRSDGGEGPVRHKIRAPSYVNIPSFRASCIGQHIADVTIILASVDPCYSCTERMVRAYDAETKKPLWNFSDLVRLSQERTRRLRKEV